MAQSNRNRPKAGKRSGRAPAGRKPARVYGFRILALDLGGEIQLEATTARQGLALHWAGQLAQTFPRVELWAGRCDNDRCVLVWDHGQLVVDSDESAGPEGAPVDLEETTDGGEALPVVAQDPATDAPEASADTERPPPAEPLPPTEEH